MDEKRLLIAERNAEAARLSAEWTVAHVAALRIILTQLLAGGPVSEPVSEQLLRGLRGEEKFAADQDFNSVVLALIGDILTISEAIRSGDERRGSSERKA